MSLGGLVCNGGGSERIPRVIHFEIPAEDTRRAVGFYRKAFGWKSEKYGQMDYWLANTGEDRELVQGFGGINGAIIKKGEMHQATVNTVSVPLFEDAVKKIKAAGGDVLVPKTAVPGIGYMAYCKDTEGNIFGITQVDPKAK